MQKKKIICLLDTSGSMNGYEQEMVDACNAFLKTIHEQVGTFSCNVYTFSSTMKMIYENDSKNSNDNNASFDTPQIMLQDYVCNGQTSLYDSLCQVIEKSPGSLILLCTDGQDTCSKYYGPKSTSEMIKTYESQHDTMFKFIGQGQEAIDTLSQLVNNPEKIINAQEGLANSLHNSNLATECSQLLTQNSPDL
jgi:uncharacterized protein with von Willebrand factor type A (vWA) domain